jgi:hypothetical protein
MGSERIPKIEELTDEEENVLEEQVHRPNLETGYQRARREARG